MLSKCERATVFQYADFNTPALYGHLLTEGSVSNRHDYVKKLHLIYRLVKSSG